jgi:dolichol-phosphate mannosyltransferase
MPSEPRVLVIIPTYDELESLPVIVRRLRAALPDADLMVEDDNSPDGTGALADTMAAADPHVMVDHRAGKGGLGPAYLAGFRYGLTQGYDVLVQIDADGSHPPERLPEMIQRLWADPSIAMVIGSRWTKGGSVVNWPKRREALSRTANFYANAALGVKVKDTTAGFRAFRASAIAAMDLDSMKAKGYCFEIDLTIRVRDAGGGVIEVPIEFREREVGTSKMSGAIVREAMRMVTVWGIRRRARQLTGRPPLYRPDGATAS